MISTEIDLSALQLFLSKVKHDSEGLRIAFKEAYSRTDDSVPQSISAACSAVAISREQLDSFEQAANTLVSLYRQFQDACEAEVAIWGQGLEA